MLVLALDTTTRGGSVAVARDGRLLDLLAGDPARPHAERVPADLLRSLDRAGVLLSQIDVFAVAIGPGSFTGLRIGIAAIQGCAFATGRPVVGVSALEALALAAAAAWGGGPARRVGVWIDAQRHEVFSALYDVCGGGPHAHLDAIDGPAVGDPAETAGRWHHLMGASWCPVAGDGAVRYRHLLSNAAGAPVPVIDPPPLAATIALVAEQRALAGAGTLPHAIRPLYVRRPDAELARDRRRVKASESVNQPFRVEPLSRPSDLDGVLEVDRLSFPSPWTRAMYEEELRQPETAFIIVLRTGNAPVAGYCSYRLVADELQINNVAVRPEHRGRGFGKALVEAALSHGLSAGVRTALLDVRRSNGPAQQLYLSLGFVQVGERPRYYSHPDEDALVLAKDVQNLEGDPAA
jgi:tRNA threonylcarbamoyl adenosine modification protein YeaZ/ribosomal-protein-alanine acetyltransferase